MLIGMKRKLVDYMGGKQLDDVKLENADSFDLSMMSILVEAAQSELTHVNTINAKLIALLRREKKNKKHYKKRTENSSDFDDEPPTFPSWSSIRDETSNLLFRRKFRMTKEQFQELCNKIKDTIGENNFRPEGSCSDFYVCGEIRTAIALRMLCGGSYLDLLGRAYGVIGLKSIYRYFHEFIYSIEKSFELPLMDLLLRLEGGDMSALDELKKISHEFSVDSNGVLTGCIGAIDGLAVRINSPVGVENPGNYFCRKNFYALNVQAICDRAKRYLWISLGHHGHGASHDSAAFSSTKL